MKKSLRNRILFPVVLGILFYIFLSALADFDKLKEAFGYFRLRWLGVILALAFLNYVLRYFKFHYYLKILGISLKHSTAFLVFLASFVMAVTPGKLGEVLKSVFLKDLTGASKSQTAPIVVAERITDLLAFILMVLIGISGFTEQRAILAAVLATFVLIVSFCLIVGVRSFSLWMIGIMSKLPVISRVAPKLLTAYESTYILITPKRLLVAVLISVPSWSCEVIAFYLVCHALGQPITLEACYFIYSVGTILGAISFLPGGLGLTEASIAGLLTQFVGMSRAYAISATLIIRFCTLWFAVVLGGVVILLFQKQLGGKQVIEDALEAEG